jgi:hypothetical protein
MTILIRAGFSAVDITPPADAHIPGGFRPVPAQGVRDPLEVTAAVITDDDMVVALVGVDAVSLKTEDVLEARALAEESSGVPAGNILVAASHVHSGGPANDVLGTDSDAHYRAHIVHQIANAVTEANTRLVPASIGWASGAAEGLAWNRRWVMRDGSHQTHADPDDPDVIGRAGPDDPEVLLLAARGLDGEILGFIGNFTCHPTVMGGPNFSAGYPGAWRRTLKTLTGGEMVFLNGAMGDITQVNKRLDQPQTGEAGVERFARMLTGESLKLLADMRWRDDLPLAVATEVLDMPFRVPSADQLEADRALLAENPWPGDYARDVVFARERVLLAEYIDQVGAARCEVKCLRIGNLAIASSPGQMFCEFGLATKARSPFDATMFVSLASGNIGYVPTAEAIERGGYEPTLCRGSRSVPEAGEMIVEASMRLLKSLA